MSRFDDAKKDMKQKRERAMETILALVEAEAKLRTKVDTGTLKRSVTHEITHSDEAKTVGRVGSNVPYAAYVELGIGRGKAQPYLRPAIEENMPLIQSIIKEELSV